MRNGGEITYLGSYHGDASLEPPEEEWWNFAIPANQQSALEAAAEDLLTDDEFAELAVNAPDPVQDSASTRCAPVEAGQTKPWWKFW